MEHIYKSKRKKHTMTMNQHEHTGAHSCDTRHEQEDDGHFYAATVVRGGLRRDSNNVWSVVAVMEEMPE